MITLKSSLSILVWMWVLFNALVANASNAVVTFTSALETIQPDADIAYEAPFRITQMVGQGGGVLVGLQASIRSHQLYWGASPEGIRAGEELYDGTSQILALVAYKKGYLASRRDGSEVVVYKNSDRTPLLAGTEVYRGSALVLSLKGYRDGLLVTFFDSRTMRYSVRWSPDGTRLSTAMLLYDGTDAVTAITEYRGGILLATGSRGQHTVYWSATLQPLEKGKKVSTGTGSVTLLVPYKNGILWLVDHVGTPATPIRTYKLLWSPDREQVILDDTNLLYFGEQPVVSAAPFSDGLLTAFQNKRDTIRMPNTGDGSFTVENGDRKCAELRNYPNFIVESEIAAHNCRWSTRGEINYILDGSGLTAATGVCATQKLKSRPCYMNYNWMQIERVATKPIHSDIISKVPGYREDTLRRYDGFDLYEVGISLLALQNMVDSEIAWSGPKLGDLAVQVGSNKHTGGLVVSGSFSRDGLKCTFKREFRIPLMPLSNLELRSYNNEANCWGDNPLTNFLVAFFWFPLQLKIGDALNGAGDLSSALGLLGTSKQDPDYKRFLEQSFVFSSVCDLSIGPSFCVRIVSCVGGNIKRCKGGPLEEYIKRLEERAPKKDTEQSPIDLSSYVAAWRNQAKFKQSVRIPSYAYPSKFNGVEFDDGDMTFAGGLLCLAGDSDGCKLVSAAQSASGAWYRSPDLVDVTPTSASKGPKSQFSGDQLLGVVAYFAGMVRKHGDGTNPEELRKEYQKLSRFIASITSRDRIGGLYRLCDVSANPYTCAMGSQEWYLLAKLLDLFNFSDASLPDSNSLPEDAIRMVQSYSNKGLHFEAALYPPGYRMHLVAVRVLLYRALGAVDAEIDRAAYILAARAPHNTFFSYLAGQLEPGFYVPKRLADSLLENCSLHSGSKYDEWIWERWWLRQTSVPKDCNKDARFCSLRWDCVFMGRLLGGKW